MSEAKPVSSEVQQKRLTRRRFLQGAAVGGAGIWAASVLPRRAFTNDPTALRSSTSTSWTTSGSRKPGSTANRSIGRSRADSWRTSRSSVAASRGCRRPTTCSGAFPSKRIVLLEGACCGYGASGRNGGFADAGMPGLGYVYENQGPEAARAYYDATLLGLKQIQQLRQRTRCGLRFRVERRLDDGHGGAAPRRALAGTKQRFDNMGIEVELLDKAEVAQAGRIRTIRRRDARSATTRS